VSDYPSQCPVPLDMPAFGNAYGVQSPSASDVWHQAQSLYRELQANADTTPRGTGKA